MTELDSFPEIFSWTYPLNYFTLHEYTCIRGRVKLDIANLDHYFFDINGEDHI